MDKINLAEFEALMERLRDHNEDIMNIDGCWGYGVGWKENRLQFVISVEKGNKKEAEKRIQEIFGANEIEGYPFFVEEGSVPEAL